MDDHALLRLGVCALVEAQASERQTSVAVLEAQNLAEALAVYGTHHAAIDLVLFDLALPDAQGLNGFIDFHHRYPCANVVVLSGSDNPALAQGSLAIGARAFISKSADQQELLKYLWGDGSSGSRQAAPTATPRLNSAQWLHAEAWRHLTARQAKILQLVLDGKANKDIARIASLSEGTVKNHVSALLLLFGVCSRAQLISRLR